MASNNTFLLDLLIKRVDLEDLFEENTNIFKTPIIWWKLRSTDTQIKRFCRDALMMDVLDNVAEVCKITGNVTKLYNNMNIAIELKDTKLSITRRYVGRKVFGSITTTKVEYNTKNADSIKYIIAREGIDSPVGTDAEPVETIKLDSVGSAEISYAHDDDDDFTNNGIRSIIIDLCNKLVDPDKVW